jgi:aminoglycoside 6'-N-acetyltransferase
MLVAWHADRDVSRYWDDETYTREEMLDRLHRPDVDAYVVEADGAPVGLVQAWFEEDPVDTGIDMFLVPRARGRGIGPDAARALVRHLLFGLRRPRVTVDPYLWNGPAVRSWTRAGFRAIGEREPDADHTARWLLMEFNPATLEDDSPR